jgi:hypothetical protein
MTHSFCWASAERVRVDLLVAGWGCGAGGSVVAGVVAGGGVSFGIVAAAGANLVALVVGCFDSNAVIFSVKR